MAEIRENLRLSDLNLEELNRIMGRLQDRLDELEGRRGTPLFKSSVDMDGNRITNSVTSSQTTDTVIQSEINALGPILWPVGSVFVAVVSTNPGTLLGFGTWVAFGAGKFLVGRDGTDAAFDTPEETGGSKTANLAHTHDMGNHAHTINHTHDTGTDIGSGANFNASFSGNSGVPSTNTTGSGGSATQSILPPYIVVYMWKRTA